MIEVSGLKKTFGDVVAIEDVSFTAADARVTGLLGHNGAGKSTSLRVLYGLLSRKPATPKSTASMSVRIALQPNQNSASCLMGMGFIPG